MQYSSLFSIVLLALALPFFSSAEHLGRSARSHSALANRRRGDLDIHGRATGVRATFYDVGLGACGIWNKPDDFIVALTHLQFGSGYPGPNCFKWITIRYGGKTARAQIVDECMGCPSNGLDLSRGLFSYFASEDLGVIAVDWWYDGDGGAPAPAPPPPSPTTHKEPPKTTSAWSSAPPPWSQSASKSKTSSAWASSATSAGYSTLNSTLHSSAIPNTSKTAAAPGVTDAPLGDTPKDPQNLQDLNDLVVKLAQFVLQSGP